ncbi:MAG: hypothetical protein U0U66_03795 [Cytophagaceae bacterium]
MKKLILTTILIVSSLVAFSQSTIETPLQNISTDSAVSYRLFATRNMYIFIKLDTRNGKMSLIQWSTESSKRVETTLSDISQVNKEGERIGRFFLYPTSNIYTFILLDQIDGRTWQVQWDFSRDKRFVIRIY